MIDLGSNSWRLVVFTYGFARSLSGKPTGSSPPGGPPGSSPPGELPMESPPGGSTWWKRTDELYETVRIGAGLESTGKLCY